MATWPTGNAIPDTAHTADESQREDLARPEIHKGLVATRNIATVMNASSMDNNEIPIYNSANSRFEPGLTSDLIRSADHPLPTASQLRVVSSNPFSIQTDITPNYASGKYQRYRFRGGVQTSATTITASVLANNAQLVNISAPSNMPNGHSMHLLIENVLPTSSTATFNVRASWATQYLFESNPGFNFASGKIHDVNHGQGWLFRLHKLSSSTILIAREDVYPNLPL